MAGLKDLERLVGEAGGGCRSPRAPIRRARNDDRRMGVTYGLNTVRVTAPVPAGSRIRGRFKLARYEPIDGGGVQVTWDVTVEREGGEKPVMVAQTIGRYYF